MAQHNLIQLSPTAKTALVIVDMQNFFGKMMDEPLPKIKILNQFFREQGWPVFLTQHGHHPDELIPPIKNQLVRINGPENILMIDTHDWQFHPEVWKMARDAPVIHKNNYDAFVRTSLDSDLKTLGVERVVICGVMTDYCCDTTARHAFCLNYETWFVSDACGTDTQANHIRALKGIERLLGRTYTAAEVLVLLTTEMNAS